MNIEHTSIEKLRESVLKILRKYLDLNQFRIFFFGSRVTGDNDERSDIDIGIEGNQPIPLAIMCRIEEEIEEMPTLYKIEIVDFCRTGQKFKKVAKKQIELFIK